VKALALAVCLCPLVAVAASEPAKSSAWHIESQFALAPGMIGEWDDWAIASPTILKFAGKWWMFYEGVMFDESGVRSAFGIAQSKDGLAWQKHSQNPLFAPALSDTQSCSSPSVTRWRDAFWVVYTVSEDPFHAAPTESNADEAPVTARLARSEDGLIWREMAGVRLPIFSKIPYPFRPCLYAEGDTLQLWWIGPTNEGDHALFHSVSRDGEKWSAPNQQPAKEIDAREICCARVYPSGNYYILSYVAYDEKRQQYSLVTKISRDARSWSVQGPPEFPLPSHFAHPTPWLLFENGGARLFYSAQQRDNTQHLRSAYCEKKAYASP
jgi:predicted GH43/DUF377 family glycosyl hydrolase